MSEGNGQAGMHRRRITLADGRYLIFYTFDDEAASAQQGASQESSRREPEPEPQSEEERRV